ncbi:hypothetical protein BH10PSE17_BH10PSE17_24130 [soil metagenome]
MNPLAALMLAAGGFFAVAIAWLTGGAQVPALVAFAMAVVGVGALAAAMAWLARSSRAMLMMVLPLDFIALVGLVDLVLRTFLQTSLRQLLG